MNNYSNYDYYLVRDGNRFFWGPFLLGGLGGAALVGLSRPRPVYVQGQPNYNPYPPRPYPPAPYPYQGGGYSYSGSNYNYYY